MNGALPPSSSETFFTCPAHCAISSLPTSVEPVKPSLRTSGFDVISRADRRRVLRVAGDDAEDAAAAGRPPRRASSTASAVSGVCSAGLSTIVQPAASAGAALRVGIAAGKFHGVMPAVTPTGSLVTTMRRSAHVASGSCRRRRAWPPRRTTRGSDAA